MIDYDYLNKLTEKDLEWLNKFTREYVSARFDTKNTRKNLHSKKKQRSDCYRKNNRRNFDAYTKSKAFDQLKYIEDILAKRTKTPSESEV